MNHEYKIQIYSEPEKLLRSEIWRDDSILGFGHPLRWVLENENGKFRLRNLENSELAEVSDGRTSTEFTRLGPSLLLRITPTRRAEFDQSWESLQINTQLPAQEGSKNLFAKMLHLSAACLAALVLSSLLIARFFHPVEDMLIPPQYAQVILNPKRGSTPFRESPSSPSAAGGIRSADVKRVTQTLIQGGALSSLARTHLTLPMNTSALAQQTFGGLKTKTPLGVPNVQPQMLSATIAKLGGSGGAFGYSQKSGAASSTQGQTFVSLETPDAKVDEGLSQDEVGRVIHDHLSEVRYCYESTLLKSANLQGKLLIDFVILATGGVKSAKVHSSTVIDPILSSCLVQHLLTWKFPKPKGGIEVAVSYPFIFKTLGK